MTLTLAINVLIGIPLLLSTSIKFTLDWDSCAEDNQSQATPQKRGLIQSTHKPSYFYNGIRASPIYPLSKRKMFSVDCKISIPKCKIVYTSILLQTTYTPIFILPKQRETETERESTHLNLSKAPQPSPSLEVVVIVFQNQGSSFCSYFLSDVQTDL